MCLCIIKNKCIITLSSNVCNMVYFIFYTFCIQWFSIPIKCSSQRVRTTTCITCWNVRSGNGNARNGGGGGTNVTFPKNINYAGQIPVNEKFNSVRQDSITPCTCYKLWNSSSLTRSDGTSIGNIVSNVI